MSKEGRLSRVGVLAPAALSACMDASVLAVPAAGAIVSTVLKELSKAFMLKKWFYGVMSSNDAEALMMERGRHGSYLVRESQAHPGEFVLSVRVRQKVTHVMIKKQNGKYDVGNGEKFEELVGLIEHCRLYPLTAASGDVLRLLQPLGGCSVSTRNLSKKISKMQEMKENPRREMRSGFDEEFFSLQMMDERQNCTTHEGARPENACKNRYSNILPYDDTRVILHRPDEVDGGYINANYIQSLTNAGDSVQSSNESLNSVKSLIVKSESKKIAPLVSKSLSDEALRDLRKCAYMDKLNGNLFREAVEKVYIATQGCLPNTIGDFWNMIWQDDVRVIAMITNEVEKGRRKCERYWPNLKETDYHDPLTVRLLNEFAFDDYIVREIELQDDKGQSRMVFQFQYTSWPDHGVPSEPDGVLAFIKDINKKLEELAASEKTKKHVLCVHCSAGVGRTGTFIVLDTIFEKINNSGYNCDVDVFSTVKLMRSQRTGMVQNRSQYRFIYHAIQAYVDEKNFQLRQRVYSSNA